MIVLKRPYITEKTMKLIDNNFYTFLVDKNATKKMVAKVVAQKFGVDVLSVSTVNIKPKVRMQRRVRKSYLKGGFKKAIVQVKKGQKIAIFETPKEEKEVTVTTAEGEPIIMKERKDILRRTKVRVEKGPVRPAGGSTGAAPTTQRKVITGK